MIFKQDNAEKSDESKEVIYWKTKTLNLINSLAVKTTFQSIQNLSIDSSNLHLLIKLRQDITSYFQEYLLLGDALAAEYLLMNLISGV